MAYTTNQAIAALNGYLGITDQDKEIIPDTKKRGFVYTLESDERVVIFIYPLVHKQDNTKNYFDTRDSGALERGTTWNYAIEHNLKYFCLGINDSVDKYVDYVFSLECNEHVVETLSGTKNGSRNGSGNQIIIPNDYVPTKKFERITNRLGTYIAAIRKDGLIEYLTNYDNRPYMIEASAVELSYGSQMDDYTAMDLEGRKQAFMEWMRKKSKSGAPSPVNEDDCYSENVVYNYANFLTNRAEQLSDFPYENTNLFYYVNPDEFTEVMEVIMADPKYPEVNQKCISKGFSPAMKRYKEFLESLRSGDDESVNEEKDYEMINYHTGYKSVFSLNRIVFGAPGTGKSFIINKEAKQLLGEGNEEAYERVTFHPDYSYANFVGTYKPVMTANESKWSVDRDTDFVVSILKDGSKSAQEKYDLLFERFRGDGLTRLPILLGLYTDESFRTKKQDGTDAANDNSVERNHGRAIRKYVNLKSDKDGRGNIAYEYVPGPFMRVYVKALKNARTGNPKPYLLIIEEINRANVAAVFGDIFQLLDRDDDNISEYPIQASEDIKKYLAKELGGKPDDYSKIRIPDNMFIWATMNSADQGVFPMDTAFKRRWDFTYLGIDDSDADIRGKYVTVGSKEQQHIEWNSLRKSINDFLAAERINEDKQLGPYFISRNIVVPSDGSDEIDSERFCNVFKSKVLMYLFEDAARQKRAKLFEGSAKGQNRYSQICAAFDEQGIGIFNSSIQTGVIVQDLKTNGYDLDENRLVKTEE